MDDNRTDDPATAPDAGRPRRAPPTIDLEASEVTTSSGSVGADSNAGDQAAADASEAKPSSRPSFAALAPVLVAAVSGAVTAAAVIALVWAVARPGQTARALADSDTRVIEMLSSRIGELEEQAAKPVTPDPALAGRFDALEKSLGQLRTELASTGARSDKLATELDEVKSAAPAAATAAVSPDLSAIEGRLAEIERAVRSQSENIAQAANTPADDTALRRLVVASMLDLSVRQNEPFKAALKAAKALAPDPTVLQPLESFAASGVPNAANLCRELLTLVPQLEPPRPGNATTGTGIVDRLQAGAAKLVRIERTDASGSDRSAIVARVTAAAVRNDLSETRRELNSLTPADRAPAQAWLDKTAERDAALAAARHFTTDAMAALAKPTP
jgi:hypothetical protein